MDSCITNLPSIATFKPATLGFIHPSPAPYFKTNRLSGFVFLTQFSHAFLDIVDPICSCHTNTVENTEHYLLHCSNLANQRTAFFDDLRNIDINYGPLDSFTLSRMLLFGNPKFSDNVNSGVIYAVIKCIESTNPFSGSIYDKYDSNCFLFLFYFLSFNLLCFLS